MHVTNHDGAPARLLSAKEAAAFLGIHPRTAARLMHTGELAACRVGPRLLRTTAAAIAEYQRQAFERFRPAGALTK